MTRVMNKPSESGSHTGSSGTICPECHSIDSFQKELVDEPVTVGGNTALVAVEEAVCQVCGYKLIDPANVQKIEDVYQRLTSGNFTGMEPVGVTYRVTD